MRCNELPPQFLKLLERDEQLKRLCEGKDPLKLLQYFQSCQTLLTNEDLLRIFSQYGGRPGDGVSAEDLQELLVKSRYRPLAFSTGRDLDQAIGSTSWIYKPYFPKGHVPMLASTPGLGKTAIALDAVKRITDKEGKWFDGGALEICENSSRKVIWCECEGFQAGIKERLKTFGINPKKVIFPFEDPLKDFRLDDEAHRRQLAEVIQYHNPVAIFVDSLRGSHRKDEKSSRAMQEIMSYLTALGKTFDIGIWVNHHVNKPQNDQPDKIDINRVRGSGTIAALCRTIVGLDKPDPKYNVLRFTMIKSNRATFPEPLGMEFLEDGTILWHENGPQDLEEVSQSKLEEVISWLCDQLKDGPKPVREVEEQLDKNGISNSTYRRARVKLGVQSIPGNMNQPNMIGLTLIQ